MIFEFIRVTKKNDVARDESRETEMIFEFLRVTKKNDVERDEWRDRQNDKHTQTDVSGSKA